MNLKTFYKIYYKHRFKKASPILKIYLFFSIFIKYLINLFYIQKVVNVDNLKILLLNACIRQARWIGKHPNALDIQHIEPSEFERTFHYGLKQIQSEDDLNKVIDWTNSDFYNPTTKEKIK